MKVLVIHTAYKLKGGEDTVVANETELLKSVNIEVETLLFSNTGSVVMKVVQLPFNYLSYVKTKQAIKAFKPDVVHIHNLHFAGSPSVIYAIKNSKVPFVITLHNYRLLCPSATLFNNGKIYLSSVNKAFSWDAIYNKVYLRSGLMTFWVSCSMLMHHLMGTWKLTNRFIALAQHTKQIFANSKLKNIANRIVVKPNFCYSHFPQEQVKENSYYLYLGRLSEEKGLNVLLKAFSENKLPLKIAGTGPLEEEVKKYCIHNPNIQLLGSVDKLQANELLANARALIFPSLWYETFGMVIIEAFAAGTPVIASYLGHLTLTVTNGFNGLHFEASNTYDLKNQIAYYENLSQAEMRIYQDNALKTYYANYSPALNAAQLTDIYTDVINEYKLKK